MNNCNCTKLQLALIVEYLMNNRQLDLQFLRDRLGPSLEGVWRYSTRCELLHLGSSSEGIAIMDKTFNQAPVIHLRDVMPYRSVQLGSERSKMKGKGMEALLWPETQLERRMTNEDLPRPYGLPLKPRAMSAASAGPGWADLQARQRDQASLHESAGIIEPRGLTSSSCQARRNRRIPSCLA